MTEEKGFFKKFIYDSDAENEELSKDLKPSKTKAAAPVRTASYQTGATVPTMTGAETGSGKIKEKLVNKLQDKVKGTAYAQFQLINSAMKTKIADPSTRLIAAGASLGAQNVTKQAILEGANNALSFLESEAQGFAATIANDIQNLDRELSTKKEAIEASIKQKNADIVRISEEMAKLQQDKSQLEIDIAASKNKLELVKAEFGVAHGTLTQEIQSEVRDINQYMGV
jgi:hypothetical protein